MKSALKYSSKVWLTTILIGSLIMGVRIYFMYDWAYSQWAYAFDVPEIGIPAGIVLYLPSWFLLALTIWYLNRKANTIIYRKVWLSFIAIILSVVPFIIIDYRLLFYINHDGIFAGFPPDLFWTITYVGLTVAGVWFYKLVPVNNPTKIVETSPK